eukprot:evm.model.scf_71.3 EVM.evm.TU.scf_71.3   scf_71:52055-54038(+)
MFAPLRLHPTPSPALLCRPSPRPTSARPTRLHPPSAAVPAMAERSREQVIAESIREIPDFPKPGIQFYDITTTLLDPAAFKACVDLLVERYQGKNIDAVAGFEARGLIFGAPLALALGCAFVPLRKPKKLPGETIGEEYELEYGSDRIEMHVGAVKEKQRVLLVGAVHCVDILLNSIFVHLPYAIQLIF